MKKWNKKLALAMLSLGFASFTPNVAKADYFPNNNFDVYPSGPCSPCPPCDPCKDTSFSVGVDFLYWKPCVDDLDYAAAFRTETGTAPPSTSFDLHYKSVCPDWEPGVRVRIGIPGCWRGFDVSASYTYLKSSDSNSTEPGIAESILATAAHPGISGLVPNGGFFTEARAKWELKYNAFDVLFHSPFRCNPCHLINPFFGIEGIWLNQNFDARYEVLSVTDIVNADWESDYFGIGLKAGVDYTYTICDGLSLFARGSASLLTGDSDSKGFHAYNNLNTAGTLIGFTDLEYHDDDCCHIVPGYHIQAGFNYEGNSCGCEYNFRIGYEFLEWHNVSNYRRFFSTEELVNAAEGNANAAYSTQTNTSNLGFHGLFAGFDFEF